MVSNVLSLLNENYSRLTILDIPVAEQNDILQFLSRLHITIVFAATMTFGATALGQDAVLISGTFNEELREQVPISGAPIIGVTSGELPQEDIEFLSIFHPHVRGESVTICLTAASQDGRYRSANNYRLPNIQSRRLISLPYPTAHSDFLKSEHMTALARLGHCHSKQITQASVVFLDSTPRPGSEVSVAVNGGGNSVYVTEVGDQNLEQRCKRTNSPRPIAYDSVCPVYASNADRGIVRIRLEERRGPEVISTIQLNIQGSE